MDNVCRPEITDEMRGGTKRCKCATLELANQCAEQRFCRSRSPYETFSAPDKDYIDELRGSKASSIRVCMMLREVSACLNGVIHQNGFHKGMEAASFVPARLEQHVRC